jgi:hypothetical protein
MSRYRSEIVAQLSTERATAAALLRHGASFRNLPASICILLKSACGAR